MMINKHRCHAHLKTAKTEPTQAANFCDDENSNSYPAVFYKKGDPFDTVTLKEIAQTHRQMRNYKKVLFYMYGMATEIRIYNYAENPYDKEKMIMIIKMNFKKLN